MSIKVESAWEINEIILQVEDGTRFLLLEPPSNYNHCTHGTCGFGQIGLSLEKAKQLVSDLQSAIQNYEELEESIRQWDKECTDHYEKCEGWEEDD